MLKGIGATHRCRLGCWKFGELFLHSFVRRQSVHSTHLLRARGSICSGSASPSAQGRSSPRSSPGKKETFNYILRFPSKKYWQMHSPFRGSTGTFSRNLRPEWRGGGRSKTLNCFQMYLVPAAFFFISSPFEAAEINFSNIYFSRTTFRLPQSEQKLQQQHQRQRQNRRPAGFDSRCEVAPGALKGLVAQVLFTHKNIGSV